MAWINDNYRKLPGNYLFAEIAHRVAAYRERHPSADIISLGIGDVTRPLPMAAIRAMHEAVDEMSRAETFRGYGPEQGYPFLRKAIAEASYEGLGIEPDEIFVSDGSKSDCGNIQEIFGIRNRVAIADPVYPVYLDTNIMAGRAGRPQADGRFDCVTYLPCTEENGFTPQIPTGPYVDLIYLCSPNNPTGAAMTREDLAEWIDFARERQAVILFDAAYEAYIKKDDPSIPHSIYEIEGAREVAIEFRSFSKTAGFTGTRCGYTVLPKTVMGRAKDGSLIPLHSLWNRRHTTKFNGVPYIVQRGAAAIYTEEGRQQVDAAIGYYRENARVILAGLKDAGWTAYGGIHSPYIWLKTPGGIPSWELFGTLLEEAQVVGTPGAGFGPCGEGYLRLTAFGDQTRTAEAIERIKDLAGRGILGA